MAKDSDYEGFYVQYMKKLKAKTAVEVKKATRAAYAEYFEYAEKRIREIFNDIIQSFYDSYSPRLYHRSYSMFNLIKTEVDHNDLSLSIWFEPSEMSPMRSQYKGEDGLYDLVFRKGWHGGADKISSDKEERWGVHPQPGIPYWRNSRTRYRTWGSRAEAAETAPLEAVKIAVEKYEKTESGNVFNQIWRKNINNIKIA